MYSAALAMVAVSNDVMELGRSGEGLVTDVPRPFSVSEVFGFIHKLLSPMAEQKNVELRLDVLWSRISWWVTRRRSVAFWET
jgi:hypothetical protein